jgi:hypothetical protein
MKKLLGVVTALTLYSQLADSAFAENLSLCPANGIGAGICRTFNNPNTGFSSIIQVLINGAFVIAIVAALGYLLYGGVKWIISQGDKTKVEGARNHVVSAIIGLVIVFMSYLILNIIVQIFTGTNLANLELPTVSTIAK